jgi:pyruvate formate lyase activating enzyme
MKIAGFTKISTLDYSGKISTVVFTSGCNYECPSCHAKDIVCEKGKISEEEVFKYLDLTQGFVDGVVICGGEPTLQYDLTDFARKVKEKGLAVKLDTNGSHPEVIAELLGEKLIDYVALDIKGPPSLYSQLVGKRIDLRDDIEKAIGIVQHAPGYEFRTTIVPVYREEGEISFMTSEEAREMVEWVDQFVFRERKNVKWHVQRFVAVEKDKGKMMDENFAKENLPKEYKETPDKILKEIKEKIKSYFPNCITIG